MNIPSLKLVSDDICRNLSLAMLDCIAGSGEDISYAQTYTILLLGKLQDMIKDENYTELLR